MFSPPSFVRFPRSVAFVSSTPVAALVVTVGAVAGAAAGIINRFNALTSSSMIIKYELTFFDM